jgi:hypothetical protein
MYFFTLLSGDNLFRPPLADFKTYSIMLATNILSAEGRTEAVSKSAPLGAINW